MSTYDDGTIVNDDWSDPHGLDELLGAYALDAVDDDERRRVDDYLRINPKAAREVEQHREVATMLAFTGMNAPEGVWAKIEQELGSALPPPAPGPELAKVLAMGGSSLAVPNPVPNPDSDRAVGRSSATVIPMRRRMATSVAPWLVGAAAAVVIAVGAVALFADRSDSRSPLEQAYEAALTDRDSVTAELVADGASATALGVIDQDGHGYLDATTLPTLPSGQTYQLWGVLSETADVVSLGILGPNPELEFFTVEGGVDALAITIEASPGVISDGNPEGAFVGTVS
ncbi:MAG: anti-sigma factor domain-containing protein [Ilumatobacter sp.]|jgi:anti-sigma-K factor RskA|uniref:anti-sigma factor domain-containing protein n=1 Tax=Ilumatobacter sp. TaxID=1967498 RepID=UPI003919ADBD